MAQFKQQIVPKISAIDIKQEALVHDTQYDYYGKRLAICSFDGQVQIFDVSKPEQIHLIANFRASEKGPVWQVAWAHPRYGNLIATCSYDKKVAIWQEQKQNHWQKLYTEETLHQGSVNSIAWAPHEKGLILAACSSDGLIAIYQQRESDGTWHQPISWEAHQSGINGISWQPQEAFEDTEDNQQPQISRLASVSCDKTVAIWEFNQANDKKYRKIISLDGHTDWVRDVAWSPQMNNYQLIATCSEDKTVRLWKLVFQNGEVVKSDCQVIDIGFPAWRVSWSLTGTMLAVSSSSSNQEGVVHIYKENEDGEWVNSQNLLDVNSENQLQQN